MSKPGLPIRQRLSALTCLKAGPKAVLIEVCELAENGGKGAVTASNAYLAQRLGASERTVSRVLSDLEAMGFVVVSERQGKARQMLPGAAVRAVYIDAQPSQKHLDNLAKMARFGAVEPSQIGQQPSQNLQPNLDKTGNEPRQNASRVYGDDQNDQFNDQDDQREELALAQKKIEGLGEELAEALKDLVACRATIADLRTQLENEKKKGGANRVATSVAALPYTSEEFAAKWQAFRVSHGIPSGGAREAELLNDLKTIAAENETIALSCLKKSISMGWKTFYKPDEPRTKPSQQPERGAKPTGAAASGAYALAERLAAVDAAQRQQRLPDVGGGVATGAYTGQSPQ